MLLKTRRTRSQFEIASVGLDPALQIIGADPKLSAYSYGLEVPEAPTTNPLRRYLFCLSWLRVGAREKLRVMGLRQFVKIGLIADAVGEDSNGYPLDLEVTSPTWHFSDANISWHLRKIPVGDGKKIWHADNADGQAYLYSNGPALLFVDPPSADTGYKPPTVPGETFVFDLGTFHELRWGMRRDEAWMSFGKDGVLVEGACDIGLYAAVTQTDADTRPRIALPEGVTADALPPEERFVKNFPDARYTRIGGSILLAEEWDEVEQVQQSLVPSPTREETECHLAWRNFVTALPGTKDD